MRKFPHRSNEGDSMFRCQRRWNWSKKAVKKVDTSASDVGTVIRTTTQETGDINGLWNEEGGDDIVIMKLVGIY